MGNSASTGSAAMPMPSRWASPAPSAAPSPSPSPSVYNFRLRDRQRLAGGLDAWKTQLQLTGLNERIVSCAASLAKLSLEAAKVHFVADTTLRYLTSRRCATCRGWEHIQCAACQGNGYGAVWPKNPTQAFHRVYERNDASSSQQADGLEFEQLPPEVDPPASAPKVSCRHCAGTGVTRCFRCKGNALRLVPNFSQLFKLPHKSKTFLKIMRSPLREMEKAKGGKVKKEEFVEHVFGEALFKDRWEDPSLCLLEDWDHNQMAISIVKNRPEAWHSICAAQHLTNGEGSQSQLPESMAEIEVAVSRMEPPAEVQQNEQVLRFVEVVKSSTPGKKQKMVDFDRAGRAIAERQKQFWEEQWRKQQAKELIEQKVSEWEQREGGAYALQEGLLAGK